MNVPRAQLDLLTAPGGFWWATGIEDTFITEPWPGTGRTLDEYALTDHYRRWADDLELMARLGVRSARYGVPWHRINPARGRWRWERADAPLERMLELGISPTVDLVHYGLPRWIEGAFLHPDYPERVAEYAARLADRFKGRIWWYTPLNEPRITAWYCGRLGWWPPFRRGWRGFVEVMLAVCRGIVRTCELLLRVDPEIVPVHVDATDLYTATDPTLHDQVALRQHLVFLALDLVSGRVDDDHPLWPWLLRQGARQVDLEWFLSRRLDPDLIGINLYPMFTLKRLLRTARGLRVRMPYASPALIDALVSLYWERYRRPLMITETASRGPLARRQAWLEGSVEAVRRSRARGIPVVGYTWWPMFALVAWAYRQGAKPVEAYLEQMGLWDLSAKSVDGLRRLETPLVDAYRALVAGGSLAVGPLGSSCAPADGRGIGATGELGV